MKSTLWMLKSFDILDVCLYLGWFFWWTYVQRIFFLETIDRYGSIAMGIVGSMDAVGIWCGPRILGSSPEVVDAHMSKSKISLMI